MNCRGSVATAVTGSSMSEAGRTHRCVLCESSLIALVLTHGALLALEAWAPLWQPLLHAGHQLIAYDCAATAAPS